MSTLNLNTVELVSSLYTAPRNGAPSSSDYNDFQKEVLADLVSLSSFINDTLLPMVNALPEGAMLPAESPVGIEGRTVYSDTSDQNSLFYDSLAGQPLTLADSLRLVNGMLTTFKTRLEDMGIEVAALQTRLAADSRNDLALALENLTNSINQAVAAQSVQAQRLSDVEGELANTRKIRIATGSMAAGDNTVVITWSVPFSDNNYTVQLAMEDGDWFLSILGFAYQNSGVGINVRVHNSDSSSRTGVIHAYAIHD